MAKHEIEYLPKGRPVKEFTYQAKLIFDKRDSAKLKNQKSLDAGGEFLAENEFGLAVIVASGGSEGDSAKEMVLSEARGMVVREYLVDSYGFDDSRLKTLGTGKQVGGKSDSDWGTVQIFIYPTGTDIPPRRQPAGAGSTDVRSPAQSTHSATVITTKPELSEQEAGWPRKD